MKTKVKVTINSYEIKHNCGDIGYIDGYVQDFDNRPYAVVVCGKVIDLVSLNHLEVISTDSEN